ncbi:hypothetical protein QUB47_18490, partial [Microcoleus sp. AT9_B5]
ERRRSSLSLSSPCLKPGASRSFFGEMKYQFPFGTGFRACSTKSKFSCGVRVTTENPLIGVLSFTVVGAISLKKAV